MKNYRYSERATSASEFRAIAVTRNIYDKLEALGECKHLLLNTGPSLLPETYSLTPEEDISNGGTINCRNNYVALRRNIVNISGATLMTIAAAASTQATYIKLLPRVVKYYGLWLQ